MAPETGAWCLACLLFSPTAGGGALLMEKVPSAASAQVSPGGRGEAMLGGSIRCSLVLGADSGLCWPGLGAGLGGWDDDFLGSTQQPLGV